MAKRTKQSKAADRPAASNVQVLPPSVEEAYRRKCIQLKQRTRELEDANSAIRLRVHRIKRQVEKLRLERAFLLEQLAKRTSLHVDDSEGSDSPPALPLAKPLRLKRGTRKTSLVPGADLDADADADADSKIPRGASFVTDATVTAVSPGSESFSHPNIDNPKAMQSFSSTNGASSRYDRDAEPSDSKLRLVWNTDEREDENTLMRPDGDAVDDDMEMNYDTEDHDTQVDDKLDD